MQLYFAVLRSSGIKHPIHFIYYMAGSASEQDEANPVFWLATRAGKMGLSCPLEFVRFVPAKANFFGVTIWPYNTEIHYWPNLFGQEKKLGHYPAILTSRLVNNAYQEKMFSCANITFDYLLIMRMNE